MPQPTVSRTMLAFGVNCVLIALLTLSGCASNPTGQAQATATSTLIPIPPTATPIALTLHTLDVGGAKPAGIVAGPHGLLLIPVGLPPNGGTPSSGQWYPSSISFYSTATRRLTTIVNTGSQGSVTYETYAGDWVSYETAPNSGGSALWVFNVVTSQRAQIAGDGMPNTTPYQFWVSNTTDLVWSINTGPSASKPSKLYDYSYVTGQTRALVTSTTAIIQPEAINDTTLLFSEGVADASGNSTSTSTWLQQLSGGAPVKISDESGVQASMNADYAVWGDPHASSTYLYNLRTNQLTPDLANCLRPVLDDTGPYMVCANFAGGLSSMLLSLPAGGQVVFNAIGGDLGLDVSFYNGQGYFVNDNQQVVYFNLPSR
jgi:hypothetical protein